MKRIKTTDKFAPASGPYSLAVIANDLVFASGQIGLNTEGVLVGGGIQAETHQAMQNLGNILKASDADFSHVIKATIYLTDADDFTTVNKVYAAYFAENAYPARETIVAAALPLGAKVEISLVATRKDTA